MAKKDYSEFDEMSLNPFKVPAGKGMDHYKIFKSKAFWKHDELTNKDGDPFVLDFAEIDMLIKFVVLIVDPQSPYYDERNFDLRLDKCLRALDIDKKSSVGKLIEEDSDVYVKILHEFFKRINSHIYETWFSMKMNLHQMNLYLRRPPVPDRNGNVAQDINARRQLSQVIPELTFELVEMEMQLFPDDRLQKMISERSSDDGLGGPAEQYAEEPKYNK